MELPVQPSCTTTARSFPEVQALAVALQANLVQLRVADARKRGLDPGAHEVQVPPPATSPKYREALIDRRRMASFSVAELRLLLRESWGHYWSMRWLFSLPESDPVLDLSRLPPSAELRSDPVVAVKRDEVHALLWRLRFEQVARWDPTIDRSERYGELRETADRIPFHLGGRSVPDCTDDELLEAACEHAGLLAVLRWRLQPKWSWGDPRLMEVHERPFE